MNEYIIKYDVVKETLLPPAWDGKKGEYCKKGTKMLTLANPRIEASCENINRS